MKARVTTPLSVIALAFAQAYPSFSVATEADETIFITASRHAEPASSVIADTSVITQEDIQQSQADSISDVLKTIPSLQVATSGGRGNATSIFMRGSESDHTLILIDGIRLPATNAGQYDFSQIPVDQVERIEVVRGPNATAYGSDAIGGVINIITTGAFGNDRKRLSGSYGSNNYQNINWNSSTDIGENGHLKVTTGIKEDDGYNVHPYADAFSDNSGDEHGYESLNAMVNYQHFINDDLLLISSMNYYNNEAEYDSYGTQKAQNIEALSAYVGFDWSLSESDHAFRLSHSAQDNNDFYDDADYCAFVTTGCSENDSDSYTESRQISTSWISSFYLSDTHTVNLGTDYRADDVEASSAYSSVDADRTNVGLFASSKWATQRNIFEISARGDDNSDYDTNTTWSVRNAYRFLESYQFITSVGTAFKAPSLNDLHDTSYGNESLEPEESTNYEVGVDYKKDNLHWRINAFRNDVDNLIAYNFAESQSQNIAEATNEGIEARTEFSTGMITHQLSYMYLSTEDTEGNELARRAQHSGSYGVQIALSDKWDLLTQYQYTGSRIDYIEAQFANGEVGAYDVFNLATTYRVLENLHLKLRVDNVFDEEYAAVDGYPAPGISTYGTVDYYF
ncbi:TonB-dependent receptor [Vibrio sp.]|nr:TonB-dependent receptor [Vibrio sp.]